MQEFTAGKLHRFLPSWGVPVTIENIPRAGGGVASASFCAMIRAVIPVAPPGANVTMMRTGRSG
jgi:hypothetical protein